MLPARQLSSPRNILSPSARSKLIANTNLVPSRWQQPPSSGSSSSSTTPSILAARLEKTLVQVNDLVYKPLGKGKAQVARRAVKKQIETLSMEPNKPSNLWSSSSESWTLQDIALFEASFTLYGKDFVSIQQVVSSKSMNQIVDFFYIWKMTSHYRVWKHNVKRTRTEQMAAAAEAKAAAQILGLPKPTGASSIPLKQFWGDGKNKKSKEKGSRKRGRSTSSFDKNGSSSSSSSSSGNDGNGGKKKKKKTTKTKGGLRLASLHGVDIKPEDLKKAVNARGGIKKVRKDRKWQLIRLDLKLQQTSSSGHTLNKAWTRYFDN